MSITGESLDLFILYLGRQKEQGEDLICERLIPELSTNSSENQHSINYFLENQVPEKRFFLFAIF